MRPKGMKGEKSGQNAIFDHYYPLTNPSGCDEAQKRIPFFHHLSINCHSFITRNGFSSLNGLLISSTLWDIPLRVWGGKGSGLVSEVEGFLSDNEVYFWFSIVFFLFTIIPSTPLGWSGFIGFVIILVFLRWFGFVWYFSGIVWYLVVYFLNFWYFKEFFGACVIRWYLCGSFGMSVVLIW